MKDYRLQGQHPAELSELIFQYEKEKFELTDRLECLHCGESRIFFAHIDMLVCVECLARHYVAMPVRFLALETHRIRCECKDFRVSVWPKKMSCKRCGKVQRWAKPLEITRLYQAPPEFEEKVEILTGHKLRKVLEEGLDA